MDIEKELTPEQEDVRYLQEKLEETHFDLYRNVDETKFTEALESAADADPGYFKIALQEALALIGDAHISIQGFLNGKYPPIECKEITGKFYIIGASEQHTGLIGQEIKQIDGYTIEEIIPKVSKLSSKESREVLLAGLPVYMTSNSILKYYGLSNGDTTEISTDIGKTKIAEQKDIKIKTRNPFKWKTHELEDSTFLGNRDYRLRMVGETLLFQYNSCTNENHTQEELKIFKRDLLKLAKTSKTIVVDLRQNSGGNTSVMGDLFEKFPVNKKIYVAIGRKTFSSAIHHLFYLKNNKNAVLIGENAGQKPNRFGDHKVIELPNSHIKVNCSYKYFEFLPGQDLDVIEPDIKIPVTIEDYKNETDPLNKWIKDNL